ncbi:hypothetical protein AB6A40_004442 [Gnathostoma spinigerum]|uniref:Uncharacterized protein n=1 Tax=Gnathostoma spinigerum TaxID=75299 RepID=A0ABD6ECN1_9BILA
MHAPSASASQVLLVGALLAHGYFVYTLDELHCTHTASMQTSTEEMGNSGREIQSRHVALVELSLKETICLNFTESQTSELHAIEFLRLEQRFPVLATYQFAIPQLSSSCICDCAGAEQYCSVETHRYKNCTKGALCYRTYHPYQSNSGCLTSAMSTVCCEITINPFIGRKYTAVKLEQPDSVVILMHRIYERTNNRWIQSTIKEIDVLINKGSAKIDDFDNHEIEIRVASGRAIRHMADGMYYFSDDDRHLMRGARINDPSESDIHKLGWLRSERGQWSFRNGAVKISDAQHITVESCKGQKYLTQYNADYYVINNEDITQLDMGYAVEDSSWVDAVKIGDGDRTVNVVHGEGVAVRITLTSRKRPLIVHHSSQLIDFNGSIQMDQRSNRYLNLSVEGGKGTLIGYVHQNEEKTKTEWSFSMELGVTLRPTFLATVGGIPPDISSDRFVCIHPAGDMNAEICHWLSYEALPLPESRVARHWLISYGECPGCNERGFDNFLSKLDPREWLNGFGSTTELVTCLLEITIIIAAFLMSLFICTKCIVPLMRWLICIAKPPIK